tara:strand:- start:564 stop:719 length:156 start_codon:yes stop_codon:yes gene_type:complete
MSALNETVILLGMLLEQPAGRTDAILMASTLNPREFFVPSEQKMQELSLKQ